MTAQPLNPSNGATDLHGRVAIVTGAAQGIGRRIAEVLATAGAQVRLSDIDTDALSSTVDQLRSEGLAVDGARTDSTDPDALRELVDTTRQWGGGVDIVVANSGRMSTGGVADTDLAAFEDGLRVNLTSAFLTCKAALPALRTSPHGRIVLMASGAAYDPRTVAGIPYAVAKAGIVHMAAMLAVELTGTGVTVNAIAPGAVDTRMARSFGEGVLENFAARSVMGRIATSDDVAKVALFLASDLGGFVNGQTIRVAGGP